MTALSGPSAPRTEPAPAGAELAAGYVVLDHLRRGETLDVYDVWSRERYCRCVAKTMRPDRAGAVRARDRLLQEGRLLQTLSHPHLVRGYATLLLPRPTVILETLPGQTLDHLLGARGWLAVQDLAYLGLQLCAVLRYIHDRGYLHLDIKPSNIIAVAGQAKLLDLSLARQPGRAAAGIGTRGYRSPEQTAGGALTAAADLWGLGVTLHEAATGFPPVPTDRSGTDTEAPGEIRGPALRRWRRLPRETRTTLEACLASEAADRPGISALVRALQLALPDADPPAPPRG